MRISARFAVQSLLTQLVAHFSFVQSQNVPHLRICSAVAELAAHFDSVAAGCFNLSLH